MKKLDATEISSGCSSYIALLDACRADIDANCAGKEYTSDTIVCLTEWTKNVPLSDECTAALPKKEETKVQRESDKLGSDSKRKADKRRK